MAEASAEAHATRRFLRVVPCPALLPSPAVTPLVAIVAGLLSIVAGTVLLRTYGPRVRVGRLLAVTPAVSVAEAREIAASGARRYVRVDGRIDADVDFPDEHERPLVLRRRRLEARRGSAWRLLDEQREAVPFRLREGLDEIDVDEAALDVGLVTLVRESVGTAAEAAAAPPGGLPGGLADATPVRLRIEQLSSVEHATVLGMPALGPGGRPRLGAGTGRPLVVSTLERDEAMRVLAGGRRTRPLAAAGALVAGMALIGIGLAWALLAGSLA
jgi:hypothetical protein